MFAYLRLKALPLTVPCLLLCACGDKGPPAGGVPPAMPVSAATVIQKEIKEWDEFTGKLEAVERVAIRPRVSGSMDKVYFKEGKEVTQGELLFQIDPRPFEAELQRAQADAARAQAQLELAKSQLVRSEELVKSGFISQQGLDEKVNAQRGAMASLRAAEATIATAKLNLGYTRIRAPISGRIGRAEVTEGNLVSGGGAGEATLLTTIVSLDPIYAYFEADEQIYLKYGQLARDGARASSRTARNPVFMGLSNEEGFPHEGYMDFVDNELNTASGTMRARAVFDNKERMFTPGLFARLKLVGSGTYQAILINDRAVGTDQSKKFVLVIGDGNILAYREVKLGPVVDGLRVVRSGLKPGDKIVVNGLQRVRPGMPVAPQMVPMGGSEPPTGEGPKAPAQMQKS